MKYHPRLTLVCRHAVFAALLLFAAAPSAAAQAETFVPFTLRADMTDVLVWTADERTHARVVLTFPMGGFRVTAVGPVARQGNDLFVDFAIDRFTGPVTQGVVVREFFFDLGALPAEPGTFTFTVRSRGTHVRSVAFDPRQVVARWEEASLPRDRTIFTVWTAGGVTFAGVEFMFPEDGYRIAEWRAPERAGNDFVSRLRVERWTGGASTLRFRRERRIFSLGQLPPGETFTFSLQFSDGVRHTGFPWTPAGQARPASTHPLDDPAFFVRQHYVDFLGREPDPEGLTFWYDELVTNCPLIPSPCMDARRVQVSAAFFLSIEFERTGFYVYRMHRAATGQAPRMNEFFADTRKAAGGVVVGRERWEESLEENQRRFAEEFVARPAFKERYPETMSPAGYVDALDDMISHPWRETEPGALSDSDRERLIQALASGAETRATVLRKMAAHPDFVRQEVNPAFVLMQYYGYLRRDPDGGPDTNLDGYRFWLGKLNFFRGNFVEAEMVKAFLDSSEYRARFAPR